MEQPKIAIVVRAGARILSLERLIAQRSMVCEVTRNPCRGVSLLCRVLRSNRCNCKNLRMVRKSLPCGLVAGKSLPCMAIMVENFFRPHNGRSGGIHVKNTQDENP
jgi:hypothetical protein